MAKESCEGRGALVSSSPSRHPSSAPPPELSPASNQRVDSSKHVHVESLVKVGVQGLFDDRGRVGRFPIDSDDGEGVGQAKIG